MRFLPGLACSLTLAFVSGHAFLASVQAAETPEVSFERDVRPILKGSCFTCHGESGVLEGELDVRLSRFLISGGDSGPAIVPGKRDESLLYQRVRDGEMPPEQAHRLSAEQVEIIGKWIDSGAKTLRPEPEKIEGMLITEEELSHWAYQPLKRPAVPSVKHADRVRTPIDAFLLAKLEEQGFSFSEDAAEFTQLRRAWVDLVGMIPPPEEVREFQNDTRFDAWQIRIDELLSSPHYGERWGRHWLDVAGYADSDGYTAKDAQRAHSWRYRDYVIKSFNNDKPFDRFILEQLAGDELITTPLNNLSPEDGELLAAVGFLRMAPDGTGGGAADANLAKNDTIAETVKIVSSSLLGLTVGCAQCHDHRYDPIPIVDYYRFRAIFDPALNWKAWKTPNQRLVSLYTDEDRKVAAEIEAKAKVILDARKVREKELIDATFKRELAKLPKEVQDAAQGIQNIPAKKRTPEQKALVKKYPVLNISAGSLYLYDRKAADELKKMAAEAKKIRDTKPEQRMVHTLVEPSGKPPESFVFNRGDYEQPKEKVLPAGLSVVSMNAELPDIPENDPDRPTTGRRTALAKRLTDRNHPLTARVIVNRLWMHHFGKALVATPADFGVLGTPPTHPELLDWLAVEFIESGWSVKHMHRLMMQSTAYRQALRTDPAQDQSDPDNLLYGGSHLKRLDAEALRDSILAVSDQLNPKLYGEAVPVIADKVGRWVLGIENLSAGRPGPVIPLNGLENVRSVYVEVRRSRPLAVLDTFDWPRMEPNCARRHPSTGTPQSLMLMNSNFVLDYAAKFARRIEKVAGEDPKAQIALAWQLAFNREPDTSEAASALSFLEEETALFTPKTKPAPPKKGAPAKPTPQQRALDIFCQMLLSSNEFLYVD